jgi:hypothetical protein
MGLVGQPITILDVPGLVLSRKRRVAYEYTMKLLIASHLEERNSTRVFRSNDVNTEVTWR